MSVTIQSLSNTDPALELNVSNSNFRALWSALGFMPEECGGITGDTLEEALNKFKPMSLTTEAIQEGNFFEGGRTPEQVARYYWSLRLIAKQAKELEEPVVWA